MGQCQSTFPNNNSCTICQNVTKIPTAEGCATADKLCQSSCPQFYYFEVSRNGLGTLSSQYYTSFIQGATLDTTINGYNTTTTFPNSLSSVSPPPNEGTAYYYRQDTNYCKLCSYQCTQCIGPSNLECLSCVDTSYLIMNYELCMSTFPSVS